MSLQVGYGKERLWLKSKGFQHVCQPGHFMKIIVIIFMKTFESLIHIRIQHSKCHF
jgi:hypothetical protein